MRIHSSGGERICKVLSRSAEVNFEKPKIVNKILNSIFAQSFTGESVPLLGIFPTIKIRSMLLVRGTRLKILHEEYPAENF